MARRRRPRPAEEGNVQIIGAPDTSLLDLLDRLLDKGVMAHGDITLGVAGVDLIYLRLSALLSAVDRVLPTTPGAPTRRRQRRSRAIGRRGAPS